MSMAKTFAPKASRRLFDMLANELDDEYLSIVEDHLRRLAISQTAF